LLDFRDSYKSLSRFDFPLIRSLRFDVLPRLAGRRSEATFGKLRRIHSGFVRTGEVGREGETELIGILRRLGLSEGTRLEITPLTGGVSSDILRIDTGRRVFVVKRALPKLRVAAEWEAPVERNAYEVAWMETARRIVPDAVPEIIGHDAASGLFAMTYLDPASHAVWKAQLRDGAVDLDAAAEVGRRMALIHAATAGDAAVARRFATDHIFRPIRLEPYLEATARKHASVAERLMRLSRETLATKIALVHGDISPKNILIGPNGPVFLDAECAWYGDPAFDLAFCLNHLMLKCLWNRPMTRAYLDAFDALRRTYLAGVTWESAGVLEARAARLLAGLFLARVDGKSPVEYISAEADRELVRETALPFIAEPAPALHFLRDAWAARLGANER
jgi:aminoglycoside phosphotransferase (APT) family kinase protein